MKRAIVLIPGYMLDEALWRQFELYLPTDWIVYHAPVAGGNTIKEIARSLASVLPEKFILVGFSLGGYVARQLAADFPHQVESLIVIASSLREDTTQQIRDKQKLLQVISVSGFQGISRRSISRLLHPDNASAPDLITQIQLMGRRLGSRALLTQIALNRRDIPATSISCPTLIIASKEDPLRSLNEAIEMKDAIPGASLRVIEGSGHMLPLEQPETLASAVMDWVKEKDAIR